MKLIRLTSANNGKFKSSFGNNIIIAPMSKMALLNLTFKTKGQIQIDSTNSLIEFSSDSPNAPVLYSINLDTEIYNLDNIDLFFNNLSSDLNANLILNDSFGLSPDSPFDPYPALNNTGSEFNIVLSNGFNEIKYKYACYMNPLVENAISPKARMVIVSDDLQIGDNRIQLKDFIGAVSDRSKNILNEEGRFISRGSSVMHAQITGWLEMGGSLQNNGGGIGLSTTDLGAIPGQRGTNILDEHIALEIKFNRKTQVYQYIDEPGTPLKNSTIMPYKVDGTELSNDVIFIDKNGATFEIGVIQTAQPAPFAYPAERHVLGTYTPTVDANYHPYLYVQGAMRTMSFTMWNLTISPNIPGNGNTQALTGKTDISGFDNKYRDYLTFGGYLNLPEGNDWTQSPTAATETFTTVASLGIAAFVRLQTGSAIKHWWEPTSATDWNIYFTLPAAGATPDSTAVADLATGILTIGGGPTVFTPAQVPSMVGNGYDAIPKILENRWGVDGVAVEPALSMSNTVWTMLGYDTLAPDGRFERKALMSPKNALSPQSPYVALWKATSESSFLLSDNFIVMSNTLALDSYDASQVEYTGSTSHSHKTENAGRRKNILMTIPVNNNINGIVEYQSNTPIFIDINNVEPINIKNFNLRVVDQEFNNIQTDTDISIMTILIDG